MSISRIIPDILYGQLSFCCLCLSNVDQNAVYTHDEIFTDCDCSVAITMDVILNTIFGHDTLDSMSAFGIICGQCTVAAVNSYKFITMCKNNNNRLNLAINSIKESFENTLMEANSYKTLCVSVDMNDFTSKQYYDDSSLKNPAEVLKKINHHIKRVNVKDDPNVIEQKYLKTVTTDNKRNRKFVPFDIPKISTDLLADHDSDFRCKQCLRKFLTEKTLRNHFFRKHFPKNMKCPKCPQMFISTEMLKEHEKNVHEGICKICGKQFSIKSVLKKHEQSHTYQITCSDCGRQYRSDEAFKKHISDDVCSQKMKKSVEHAIYECDYCHKKYCYKFYLAKHIMHEHCNVEGFRCEYCNKLFYTSSRLKTHLVKHTKEKKFMCGICEKLFVTRESLLYHVRLHTGETPYKCDYCDKSFINASRRLEHTRRNHLPPGFECDICHAKFKAAYNLRKHKQRHLKHLKIEATV